MSQITTIAIQEIKAMFKERVFFLMLFIFVMMTVLSSFIGFTTLTTTNSIYRASVIFLQQNGVAQVAANPLATLPPINNFRNVIVYMFLIGTLLSIVIGHRSVMRERKAGTLQLTFTRPISKISFLLGKLLGIGLLLIGVIGCTALASIVSSLFIPFQHLGGLEIIRLLYFYLNSFFYLFLFSLIGLFFGLVTRSESLALFIPVCIWVAISFVLPELVSGQTPTALLNPVTIDQLTNPGSFFTLMQQILNPISLGWHYTTIASNLLSSNPINIDINQIIVFLIVLVVSLMGCFWAVDRFEVTNDFIVE